MMDFEEWAEREDARQIGRGAIKSLLGLTLPPLQFPIDSLPDQVEPDLAVAQEGI